MPSDLPTDPRPDPVPAEPAAPAEPVVAAAPAAGAVPAVPAVQRPTLWSVARTPRMIALLMLFLAVAAVCARLGAWQLERAEVRGASAQAAKLAEIEAQAPVPLEDVLAPQSTFDGGLVGRRVEVTGRYEADGQLLVVDRALDGRTGYLVLTPLRVASDDPGADGAVLPVVRGWVADGDPDAALVEVPAGDVRVTGYLQGSEDSGAAHGALAPGTTDSISSAELLGVWGGPIWTGYAVLTDAEPAQDPGIAVLPPPTRAGTGLNIQNLGYAAQWFVFGGFAVFLWVRLLKDEVLRESGELGPEEPGPDGPRGPEQAPAT
ncbi:SURF1 family protein [Cellulomonas sp. Marseille-Q8402]